MGKKTLRTTVSQTDNSMPLQGQPSRDHAALILPITAIRVVANVRADPGDLDELVASVKEHGVLQALVVAKTSRGLELVAGHRRLEAARLAGLTEVPVRISNIGENEIAVLRIVENVIRKNLSGIDEVLAVAALAPIFSGNQVELARALGKSKSYVSKCIKAAGAIKDLKVSDPKLPITTLFELAYAPDPKIALESLVGGMAKSGKDVRKPSGPIPGGRFGPEKCMTFNERKDGKAFSLRLNVDYDRTPQASRQQIIKTLETILRKLRGE